MIAPDFISIVVPVYNEAHALKPFLARLAEAAARFPLGHEIIFVNDGSVDGTEAQLLELRKEDQALGIVSLSRNFGKEAAIVAGLTAARGRAAIIMDVDLQDPPELLPEMIAKWQEGADVVIALRSDRSSDSFSKRASASLFYALFARLSEVKLPPGSGDFRLMDRKVIEAFLKLDERARFNKGLFAWLGFRQAFVSHVRPRAARPGSRWRPLKLIRYGFEGIFAFSSLPIRVWSVIGGALALGSLAYGIAMIAKTLVLGVDVPGYASLMVAVLFLGGLNLFTLGLIGEYIGQVLTETKHRPIFIVRESLDAVPAPPAGAKP